ncbi:MAG: outer membrane beta-barrel protein [Bacteroidetes bacterium]|jgi:opacity protein-like surface antigen|nr:outer membrane beta-barrel protein [Bacteroidota bacterium]
MIEINSRICIFLSILFLSSGGVWSQNENKGWEVGGRIGGAFYFGDLNTDFDLSKPGFMLGLGTHYNLNNRLALGFMVNGSRVYYRDDYSTNLFQQARNLSFRTDIYEFATRMEFNFLEYIHGDIDHGVTPYLHAGLSVFYYRPSAELDGERFSLRSLGTEGQPPGEEYFYLSIGFVYGAGLKVDLNYRWSIQIDLSARLLSTDYIDDVSQTYAGDDEIRSLRGTNAEIAVELADRSIPNEQFPQIGQPGRQRGNGKNNDAFAFLSVGIYRFFGHMRCPKVSPLH